MMRSRRLLRFLSDVAIVLHHFATYMAGKGAYRLFAVVRILEKSEVVKVCLRSCQRYFSLASLSARYQADFHSLNGIRKSTA